MRHASRSFVLLAALTFSSSPSFAADLVTTCGQHVTDGILAGDLDCTGYEGAAVSVGRSLSLAGFTITGSTGSTSAAIDCDKDEDIHRKGNCAIRGPGTVSGSS